jgi:pimeloyl-ACP methyl ester carboxylesterase
MGRRFPVSYAWGLSWLHSIRSNFMIQFTRKSDPSKAKACSYRHRVTIHPAHDAPLVECQWCGGLGVSLTDEAADTAKHVHETFGWVLADKRSYSSTSAPVLLMGTEFSTERLRNMVHEKVADLGEVAAPDSGHLLAEEQPEVVAQHLVEFLT